MKTNFFLLQFILSSSILLGLVEPDPDPLQDFCVADTKYHQTFFCNGAPCTNPVIATSAHFTTSALSKPGNTKANPFGFNVTLTNLLNLPGLNTLGLSMARVDVEPNGLVPPHAHPRASEVIILLKGSLLVGFVDTSNRMLTQQLQAGDSFVFPKGLVHFLYNRDSTKPALGVAGLSSQNPGAQIGPLATFASRPPMADIVLEKAFKISIQDVKRISKNLGG